MPMEFYAELCSDAERKPNHLVKALTMIAAFAEFD